MRRLATAIIWGVIVLSTGFSQSADAGSTDTSGLLHQSWFKDSNLDLGKDLADAKTEGKILAVLFEQRGCTYCQQMHEVNFQDRKIVDFLNANFSIVQLDFRGERDVISVAGERIAERKLAREYHVNGTPNVVFINQAGENVYRMPGYAEPGLFLAVFEYVKEKAYEHSSIQDWYKNRGS
jgi:thioredoxin-related protein